MRSWRYSLQLATNLPFQIQLPRSSNKTYNWERAKTFRRTTFTGTAHTFGYHREDILNTFQSRNMGSSKTPPPPGKVIPSIGIFQLKEDDNCLLSWYKGHVVAIKNLGSDHLGLAKVYAPVKCKKPFGFCFLLWKILVWKCIIPISLTLSFTHCFPKWKNLDKLSNINGFKFTNGQIVCLRKSIDKLR